MRVLNSHRIQSRVAGGQWDAISRLLRDPDLSATPHAALGAALGRTRGFG